MVHLDRREFFRLSGAAAAGTTASVLGFGTLTAVAAEVRPYKLARTTETRNTCPYCSVSCGMIIHSTGDGSKNTRSEIIHVEGDPDHPVNRGSLCPKGAGVLDYIHSETRVKQPMYRAGGEKEFKPVTWDFAMERITRLMKDDRDANFKAATDDGQPLNAWPTIGFLASSGSSNETGWLTYKAVRALGIIALDTQARI
ncbi:MAG: sulfate ABC transporter substrate-binding protein [Rhodospirillales bacterium]|nr:MAG: sulfate ABC transporter substrate-binding protein [Rhodospirillales bacterium]